MSDVSVAGVGVRVGLGVAVGAGVGVDVGVGVAVGAGVGVTVGSSPSQAITGTNVSVSNTAKRP